MYPEASCYSVLCCGAVKYLVYVIGIFMKKILSLDFDCTWYSITRSLTYLVPDIFLYGNRYTGTVYDVCITPPGAFFPRSIARQPKRCPSRTTRLRKALGEMLSMPTFVAPSSIPTVRTVDISTMESRPRGGWCYIHRRSRYVSEVPQLSCILLLV